jgi:large subunit ribosomal protein L28
MGACVFDQWVRKMSRKCMLTGKKSNNGYTVSFSHRRNKHLQMANLQWKRIWDERNGCFVRLKLSTKAIKTLEHRGLHEMAQEAGLDLSKFRV